MQFIDLAAQQKRIQEKIKKNINRVLNHGQYIMGPEVGEIEQNLAKYVGVKHAVSCSSGTDAILMSLMAFNIGPGDAIFTTPFTFIATAEMISLLKATPVFVDIDPNTFNIDPDKLTLAVNALRFNDSSIYPLPKLQKVKTQNTKLNTRGVIAVNLFGLPADYDSINTIAHEFEMFVIEDGAQSFGAEYKGKKSCGLSEVGCTSFFPAKPFGCYGDGGMCFTDNDNIAETMKSIRAHGKGDHKYDNTRIGINGRLDTLQAAILLAKLSIFPEEIELRQIVANCYNKLLKEIDLIISPKIPDNFTSAWAQYSLLAKDENHCLKLQQNLKEKGIPTAIYYPKPLHLQKVFAYLGYKEGDFPISEDCAKRIFSLPMHPYMNEKDQVKIANIIKYAGCTSSRITDLA